MKITIIYGTMCDDSTYHYVQLLLNELNSKINSQVREFFLPKDLPQFCCGCFSCFINPEDICPHFNDVNPIMKSLEESDLIILASPVYNYDASNQMKSLLNHLSYRWMPHRENRPSMSDKIGLVVSTTDGNTVSNTTKIMKKNLRFWGVKKIYTVSNSVFSMGLDIINTKSTRRINKEMFKSIESNLCLKKMNGP